MRHRYCFRKMPMWFANAMKIQIHKEGLQIKIKILLSKCISKQNTVVVVIHVFKYAYDVDIEASACVLSSRYAMLCYAVVVVVFFGRLCAPTSNSQTTSHTSSMYEPSQYCPTLICRFSINHYLQLDFTDVVSMTIWQWRWVDERKKDHSCLWELLM